MSEPSIAERLFSAERDILTAQKQLADNLHFFGKAEFFIPLHSRGDYTSRMQSSRIELLRLNNALKQIEKLKVEIPQLVDDILGAVGEFVNSVIDLSDGEEIEKNKIREAFNELRKFAGDGKPLAELSEQVAESMDFIDKHGE